MHGRYRDLYDKQHTVESNLFLAPGESSADEELLSDGPSGSNGRGAAEPDAIRIIRGQGN